MESRTIGKFTEEIREGFTLPSEGVRPLLGGSGVCFHMFLH